MKTILKSIVLALIVAAVIAVPVYAALLGIVQQDVYMWDYYSQSYVWITVNAHVGIYAWNAGYYLIGWGCAPTHPPLAGGYCAWGWVPQQAITIP